MLVVFSCFQFKNQFKNILKNVDVLSKMFQWEIVCILVILLVELKDLLNYIPLLQKGDITVLGINISYA